MTLHIVGGLDHDTPTHRRNVAEMSDEEALDHLDGVRTRRMAAYHVYKAAAEARALYRYETNREMMAHELRMFDKELERLDRCIAKLEKRAINIRALRLEIEQQ